MISRKIATNAKLARVSLRANFLYLSCIPFIDRDGRMSGDEVTIKGRVVPLRDEIPLADIPALLAELVEQGLIAWYEAEWKGVPKRAVYFPGFHDEQRGARFAREADSEYPAYDSLSTRSAFDRREDSESSPGVVREPSVRKEVKGREVKLMQVK